MQANTPADPESGDLWCVCRKFCKGRRTLLKSKRTWYRHLQLADEEEKAAIQTAHLSEQFRVHISAGGSSNPSSSTNGPQEQEIQHDPTVDLSDRPIQRMRTIQDNPFETDSQPEVDDTNEPDLTHLDPFNHTRATGAGDLGQPDRDTTPPSLDDSEPDPPRIPSPNNRPPPPNPPQYIPGTPNAALVELDLSELADSTNLPFLQRELSFIQHLRDATLDNGGITGEALTRLRNPSETTPEIEDPLVELALSMFLALEHSSQDAFEKIRQAIQKSFPGSNVPSFHQTKKILADLTGVEALVDHACVGNCVAFTGPFSALDHCPDCGEPRYDPVKLAASNGKDKSPRAVFNTIPIGPQLQALRRHPQHAENLHYRRRRTQEIVAELHENDGYVDTYDDILTGSAYIKAVHEGRIDENDFLLLFSIDGAQLYESKQSDCWIYIWIVLDHAPDQRYKKKHVLPGAIIPGPHKPKFIQSFLYPGFHHLSALQREGLVIWDALDKKRSISRPFFFLGCGDGPGLLCVSNLVGHSGKQGCRMYCPLQGRRKPRASQYYPVLLVPDDYDVIGCTHPDIDPISIINSISTSSEYVEKLKYLMASPTHRQYESRRLETGIVGPSVLLGLQPIHILGIPECFSSEIMHFAGANMASLFTDLWRGTIDCAPTDSRAQWDWAVLTGATWEQHGRAVAACKPHLPGSFDIAPRNPAEKINSFYKATEFITWVYHLAPALLYGILPEKYWRNFCKFVAGLRIMSQYSITPDQCTRAAELFAEWEREYENFYYQRRVDRIHFVRPCVHLTNHLAMEATRVGAPICSSQWTMERTIGNLEQEMRQPSDPFSNLAQQGIRRCQINTLKALFPQFDPPENAFPRGSEVLGKGYVLLRKRDRRPTTGSPEERHRISTFLQGQPAPTKFYRWGRLRLPNGQIARSEYVESGRSQADDVRISRNVKIFFGGHHRAAEVQYFTQLAVRRTDEHEDNPAEENNWHFINTAYVRLFSESDAELDTLSHGTVNSCKRLQGDEALVFIDVESIRAVIGLVPHQPRLPSGVEEPRYFVVDMSGLDFAHHQENGVV